MLLTLTALLALLVIVIVLGSLVVPTVCFAKVRLVGRNVSGATAVPDRVTICWVTAPLSLTVRVPFAEPTIVGVNVTPMTQVAFDARVTPEQAFELMEKFALMGKEEPIVTAVLPLFFTVTVFGALVVPLAWLVNERLAGENSSGEIAAPAPVPESPSSCGLAVELSVTIKAPAALPLATGVKVIETVQVPLPAMVAPHVVALME